MLEAPEAEAQAPSAWLNRPGRRHRAMPALDRPLKQSSRLCPRRLGAQLGPPMTAASPVRPALAAPPPPVLDGVGVHDGAPSSSTVLAVVLQT